MEIAFVAQMMVSETCAKNSPSQFDRDEAHLEMKYEGFCLAGNGTFQLQSQCNFQTVDPLSQRHQHGSFHSQNQTVDGIQRPFVLHTHQTFHCTSANCPYLP